MDTLICNFFYSRQMDALIFNQKPRNPQKAEMERRRAIRYVGGVQLSQDEAG